MRMSDWSSDVCSSDLGAALAGELGRSAAPSSLTRRVGLAVAEESRRSRLRFPRALRPPRGFERLAAELCRHQVLELELLLGREGKKLVGCLLCLQAAFRTLTLGDYLTERLGVKIGRAAWRERGGQT